MKGWVYVISTQTRYFLKVGYTDRDPDERAKELSRDTSSPHPHIVEYKALVENLNTNKQKHWTRLYGDKEDHLEFYFKVLSS